jgi:ABC-type dipeptide/oligopeptide/nickel transport system permease component
VESTRVHRPSAALGVVILGTVLFGTLCVVLANLAVDLIQVVIDPRIRL